MSLLLTLGMTEKKCSAQSVLDSGGPPTTASFSLVRGRARSRVRGRGRGRARARARGRVRDKVRDRVRARARVVVPGLALAQLVVSGHWPWVPERVVGRGAEQARVHTARAADLALALGRLVEPILRAALPAALASDALVLRRVGAAHRYPAGRPATGRPHRSGALPVAVGAPRARRQSAWLRLAVAHDRLPQPVAAGEHLLWREVGQVLGDGRVDVVRVRVGEAVRVVEALVELTVADERVAKRARVVAEGRAPLRGGRAIDRVALPSAHCEAVVWQVRVAGVVVAVPVGVLVVG